MSNDPLEELADANRQRPPQPVRRAPPQEFYSNDPAEALAQMTGAPTRAPTIYVNHMSYGPRHKPRSAFGTAFGVVMGIFVALVCICAFSGTLSGLLSAGDDITLNKFEQVQVGMTYNQVAAIMGRNGTQRSASGFADSASYEWSNGGSGTAYVHFFHGRVSSKYQFGLR